MAKINVAGFTTSPGSRWADGPAYLQIFYHSGQAEAFSFSTGEVWSPSSDKFYREVVCSVAGNVVTVPTFELDTTNDIVATHVQLTMWILDKGRNKSTLILLADQWSVPGFIEPVVTYEMLRQQNNRVTRYMADTATYSRSQTDLLIRDAVNVGNPATAAVIGRVVLDTAPADAALPRVVGINSPRLSPLSGPRLVYANNFPGVGPAEKINAADASVLGDYAHIIYYGGGDSGDVQIRLTHGHHLRLGDGVYSNQCGQFFPPVVPDSDTSIMGEGWNTIIEESSFASAEGGNFFVIMPWAQSQSGGATARDIHIRNLQIRGAKPDGLFNSADQAVALGNCHKGSVKGVLFNLTNAIGLQSGGNPTVGVDPGADLVARGITTPLGRFARDIDFEENYFIGVASQNLAIVNTSGFKVHNNEFRRPGQPGGPGVTVIDVEPNVFDRIYSGVISANIIDCTETFAICGEQKVTNGIAVNGSNSVEPPAPFESVVVCENQVISARHDQETGGIAYAGILVRTARSTRVERNTVQRVPRGITVDGGSVGAAIIGNSLVSCGSGSSVAIGIEDSHSCEVVLNAMYPYPLDVLVPGHNARTIQESGDSHSNIIHDNPGAWVKPLVGANSFATLSRSPMSGHGISGPGLGTGPAPTYEVLNHQGYVDVTTGSAPAGVGALFTIVLRTNAKPLPRATLSAENAAAAGWIAGSGFFITYSTVEHDGQAYSAFTVHANGVALLAATRYIFGYVCN